MKTNKSVLILVAHFLKHNRFSIDAKEVLLYGRKLKLGKVTIVMFLWSFLGTIGILVQRFMNPAPFGYSTLADTIFLITGGTFFISFAFGLFLMMQLTSWETDQVRQAEKELREARHRFKKWFRRDILKCNDAILLEMHVREVIFRQGKLVSQSPQQRAGRSELATMWDAAKEFVIPPPYKEIFPN